MNPNTTNNFFGVKVSKPGIPVHQASDKQLLYKNDYSAQTFYAENGHAISFGVLSDGTIGMEVTDENGNVLFKLDGQTWYWYDASGNIVMEVGYLALLGLYGWAVATPGNTLDGQV